jgi:hypothetical protein
MCIFQPSIYGLNQERAGRGLTGSTRKENIPAAREAKDGDLVKRRISLRSTTDLQSG